MRYNRDKKEIILDRELNKLDRFAMDFLKIVEKYTDYVIISGYVSILLGRTRATEDIDIYIRKISKENFFRLYQELLQNGFECINAEEPEVVFSYIDDGYAVRFYKRVPVPNFEVKFPKKKSEEEIFEDFIIVKTPEGELKISSLERQIAFKRYFLASEKDNEDALHIEEIFKGEIDYNKVNKFKKIIRDIKRSIKDGRKKQ